MSLQGEPNVSHGSSLGGSSPIRGEEPPASRDGTGAVVTAQIQEYDSGSEKPTPRDIWIECGKGRLVLRPWDGRRWFAHMEDTTGPYIMGAPLTESELEELAWGILYWIGMRREADALKPPEEWG